MADTIGLTTGGLPTGLSLMADGHFMGAHLGIECEYELTCKDTSGASTPCGLLATQSSAEVDWSGTLTTGAVSASVSRTGSWTVTGVHTATASFSGDAAFTFTAARRPRRSRSRAS